jgi:hypothetical protein
MSTDEVARTFFQYMVKEEAARIGPADFDLPDSIVSDFRTVSEIYLEASLLLALRSYAKEEKDYEGVLRAYENVIFPESPDFDRRAYVKLVLDAMRDLQSLFDPENERSREGFDFARDWLARMGHVELNAITLFTITDYWMNVPIIMSKTIQRMATEVVLM